MTLSGLLLFLHLLGIVLWLGVSLTIMFAAARARRTGDLQVVAFTYRTGSGLMKSLGLTGMLLTIGSGFAMIPILGYRFFEPFPNHWLFQMQVLGSLAFLAGVLYQVPVGDRLARAAEASAAAGEESAAFRRYQRRNAIVSSAVGVLLLVVIFLGAVRP